MSLNGQVPNGSAQAPIEIPSPQTVIGINFGNSFASIAVLTKEGLAECIANEDGERQIACAISFHGEETYIGNEAKQHLVKNGANTIVGFRNLLGKKFSELPKDRSTSSAPVIQHPEIPDTPAYKVQVLLPAPSPLSPAASSLQTPRTNNTPAASRLATPRSEPIPAERVLTPADVTTLFLRSLLQSAEAFLGKPVDGAVLTVPGWFAPAQLDALREAASAAGIRVLQLLEDAGAAALCAASNASTTTMTDVGPDRTQLVVDLGASSLSLSLLAVRQGLFHHLTQPAHHLEGVGGDAVDDRLLKFFAKDFTKKTSVPLKVAPAASDSVADLRAEARLRLALLHTKRTVAASSVGGGNTATCAVESLKDGLDYTGSINRLRFDMEAAPIYAGVVARAGELLQRAGLDWVQVDEVVYAGGSSCLPGLDATLAVRLRENATTPFFTGTVAGGGIGDPTTILARGAALQARLLAEIGSGSGVEDERVRKAFEHESEHVGVKATARTIGVLFPEAAESGGLGGQWIGGIQAETAVPARRTYALEVDLGEYVGGEKLVGLEVWEVKEGVKVEKVKPPKDEDDAPESEDEEEEEEVEVVERTISKEVYLGALAVRARQGRKRGSGWRASIEVQFLIEASGKLQVSAYETGNEGTKDVIVPYSELANWDGSLSDVVDSLCTPSPSEDSSLPHHSPPMYIPHQPNQQTDPPVIAHLAATSSPSHFGPHDALFPNSAQEPSSVLSPQEREIMADITLDPDDPNPSHADPTAAAAPWEWVVSTSEPEVEIDDPDASSRPILNKDANATKVLQQPQQQSSSPFVTSAVAATISTVSRYSIHPAPPTASVGIASISASVSPSPFAPPRASAPVSQLPPPRASSSSSHLTAKTKSPDVSPGRPDPSAISGDLDVNGDLMGSEDVMECTSPSASRRDDGEAGLGRNSTARHLDTPTADPPDRLRERAPSIQSPASPPSDTVNHSSLSRSPVSPRRPSKTPLFLPSPSESAIFSRPPSDPPPPERNRDSKPPEVISINSSSSSSSSASPPPPRRSRRNARIKSKTKKQGRQLMAYVLIPPLPPGAHKSDYVPLEEILRMHEHRAAKGKARVGDNVGSSTLVAALKGAFENNTSGAGSVKIPGATRKRRKAVEPVEVLKVVDDVDDGEGKGEARIQGSTDLAHALSNAFAHNSADPKVAARPSAVAGKTRQLRGSKHVETLSDSSSSIEVVLSPPPAKHSRVTSDANDKNSPSPYRRNEKRLPQTPTSPQKKKRRRLARRGNRDDVDEHEEEEEEEEEIEIVDGVPREFPFPRRVSSTEPHDSKSDPSQPTLGPTNTQCRISTSSPAPVSAPASTPPLPSLQPPSSPVSPPGTNTLAGLPLMILPAPAAADIVIPPRALNHLHASSSPPEFDYESLQGFQCEEAAVGAHGLLESRSASAAITSAAVATITSATAATTTIDSSLRANLTGLQNPPIHLGLDLVAPMDIADGEQEQMRERQDAAVRAAVVPFDALRISSSSHPEGPMLGFAVSEHDGVRCTTSLSADGETEASSDGVGLELGVDTGSDMEFMLLASMNPNSGLNAGPGWIDWDSAGPSTDLVTENEYVGDGTIDPSVLGGFEYSGTSHRGGSPDKTPFRPDATTVSDDYFRSRRSPLFMRARDKDRYLYNEEEEDSDDAEDEGDVMGLLFKDSPDGGFVSRSPSSRGAGGKGKNKDQMTVTGTRAGNTRIRKKSWRKSLADDNDKDRCEDTDAETDDAVVRSYSPNMSNNLLPELTATFCHHCRRKTQRPKMRCTRIRESTGEQCRKMYCDNCIEKRYPSLTFDEFATSFWCPCCRNFCNCTHCARGRGEVYIPERNGGWRRWSALFPVAAAATSSSTSPSPKKASQDIVGLAQPEQNGTTESAASMTESFLEANDTTRIVPVQPAGQLSSPPHATSHTPSPTSQPSLQPVPATATATASPMAVVDKKRRQYVYIGKPLTSWGRLVPVPDPDPDPEDQPVGLGRGTGRNGGKRKWKRTPGVRLFAGSEKPLLLNQSPVNKKGKGKGKGRRGKGWEKSKQRRSAPTSRTSSLAVRSEGVTNQNAASYEDSDGPDAQADAHVDVDVDEGFWPGEFGHTHQREHDEHVVPPYANGVAVIMPPEELGRAIGRALAAGMEYSQCEESSISQSVSGDGSRSNLLVVNME